MSKERSSANDELAALIAERQETPFHDPDASFDTEPTLPFLLMCLGERWFALRAESVREVVARETITRVPGQPAHVRGVALIHGRLVPVAALDILLGTTTTTTPAITPASRDRGGSQAEGTPGRRLVVISHEDAEVALMADDARGVLYLPATFEEHGGAERASFIAGEVRWEKHLVCVLEVPALMAAAIQSGSA